MPSLSAAAFIPEMARIGEQRAVNGLGNAPMLLAFCAFAAGICWARAHWVPPLWIALGAVLCAVAAGELARRRAWRSGCLGIAACFALLGALAWYGSIGAHPRSSLPAFADNRELELTGTVLNDASLGRGMFGGTRQSFDLAVETITLDGVTKQVSGAARLSVYSKEQFEEEDADPADETSVKRIQFGQRLRLRAKLNVPSNYLNPGAFDYRGYLERNGISVVGSGKAASVAIIGEPEHTLVYWRAVARRAVIRRIHALWPEQQAAILDAMLVGEDAYLGRDVRTDFQRSGTYHILVVSGFNVGILATIVFFGLRRLRLGDAWATLLTILLAGLYTYFTDAGAPVVRASLMLAVYLVARLLYRDRAALNAVATAALVLLLYDPRSLFDPSFQLTFLSVLAIAGVVVPIVESSTGRYRRALHMLSVVGYDRALDPKLAQFRLDIRLIAGRLGRVLGRRFALRLLGGILSIVIGMLETLLVSAVMQFALALPMAWYFHRATLSALAANAFVVPVTAVMLPVAIAALVIGSASQLFGGWLASAASWLLQLISGVVSYFGGLRTTDLRVPTPSLLIATVAAAGFAIAVMAFRSRHKWARYAGLAAMIATAIGVVIPNAAVRASAPTALEITAIDVGQGDSILFLTPEGKTLLLDSGGMLNGENSNFDIGEDVVSSYLWARGISRLDAVAISHTHADHAGGMAAVIRNFRPKELWLTPGAASRERERILKAAERENVQIIERMGGQRFSFGGAEFEILGPPADIDTNGKIRDDDALLLRADYCGHSFLSTADIGKKGERRVMSAGAHAEVLKIAHHGSANASSQEFLDAVAPKFAVISVGRRNTFRHPRLEVLSRLAAAHVKTYRTDLFGAVQFVFSNQGVEVRPWVLSNSPL